MYLCRLSLLSTAMLWLAGSAAAAHNVHPDAAQGPALASSFLQIPPELSMLSQPDASPSPDPDRLIQQNWAALNETLSLLRAGGYPIPADLQTFPPPGATPSTKSAATSMIPSWLLGSGRKRKLLAARASSLGSRRALRWISEMGSGAQGAAGVLGMLRSVLPAEQHSGSTPSAKQPYLKPLIVSPSENMLYKDYIPGLAGRGDSPGFMSITKRLSHMMGLQGHRNAQEDPTAAAGAASAAAASGEPRAPAMAFAGEGILHAQQEVAHIQHLQYMQQQQGPLIDAAGEVRPLRPIVLLT